MKKSEPPIDFDVLQIELESFHVILREKLSRLTTVIDELREEDRKEYQIPIQDTRQDPELPDSVQRTRSNKVVRVQKTRDEDNKLETLQVAGASTNIHAPIKPTGQWDQTESIVKKFIEEPDDDVWHVRTIVMAFLAFFTAFFYC